MTSTTDTSKSQETHSLVVSNQCKAICKNGTQCKKQGMFNGFCSLHTEKPDDMKCTKLTKRGERCKLKAYSFPQQRSGSVYGKLCKLHYREFTELHSGSIFPQSSNLSSQQETKSVREEYVDETEYSDDDQYTEDKDYINGITMWLSSLVISRSNPLENKDNRSKTMQSNILTRVEAECDICCKTNTMVLLICCRKQICKTCIKKIKQDKCPYCKQPNNMLFV